MPKFVSQYKYPGVNWSHIKPIDPADALLLKLVKWADTHPNARPETKELAKMVATKHCRNIHTKEGKNINGLGDEKDRVSYKEGGLMYLVGKSRRGNEACESCKRGNGPFKACVVVPGYFGGCCASCRYKEHQNLCSFVTNK